MAYSVIIWDVDGTLLDTLQGLSAAYIYTVKQLGLPERSKDEIRGFIGPTPVTVFQTHFGLSPDEAQYAADIFRERYKHHELLKASPYEGIIEVLSTLKRKGCRQAIATNKRQDYAEDIVRYFGMAEFCSPIYGAANTNKYTKAQLIEMCLHDLGVDDRTQAVMIGDTTNDRDAAFEAGIDFVGVNYGFGFKNVERYASSPEELLRFLTTDC